MSNRANSSHYVLSLRDMWCDAINKSKRNKQTKILENQFTVEKNQKWNIYIFVFCVCVHDFVPVAETLWFCDTHTIIYKKLYNMWKEDSELRTYSALLNRFMIIPRKRCATINEFNYCSYWMFENFTLMSIYLSKMVGLLWSKKLSSIF